jgi:hypothetical protein
MSGREPATDTSVAATAAASGHTATPQQVSYHFKVARARLHPQTVFVSSEPQLAWSRQQLGARVTRGEQCLGRSVTARL